MIVRTLLVTAMALALASCAELSEVPPGACGNHVLEAGEDCDGASAFDGASCGEPADPVTACHYTCDPGAAVSACPSGWGCGNDHVCRAPGGTFARGDGAVMSYPFRADNFAVGDIDGDHNLDLIGNAKQTIAMRFGAGDGTFDIDGTFIGREPSGAMSFGYFDDDSLLDVLVPLDAGLFVLLGHESRALDPVPYSSLTLPGNVSNVITHRVNIEIEPLVTLPFLVMISETSAGAALSLFGQTGNDLPLPGGHHINDLAAPLVVTDLDNDPTSELLMIFKGEATLWVIDIAPDDAQPASIKFSATPVTLPAPPSEDRPFLGAANAAGDSHLDVAVTVDAGSGPVIAVATNAAGTLGAATIVKLANFDALARAGVLAVGNLDFLPGLEVVTTDGIHSPLLAEDDLVFGTIDPWREAVITDINKDGLPDVVAAPDGAARLDVIYGTNVPVVNPRTIVTAGPVRNLAADDFDGDLVGDVAFVVDSPSAADGLYVTFGATSGGPTAPIFMGRLDHILGITPIPLLLGEDAGFGNTRDLITDLMVVSEPDGGDQLSLALFEGDASRRMVAPFKLFTDDLDLYRPVQAAFGNFTDDGATDVIAISDLPEASDFPGLADSRVWVIPGRGQGGALDAIAATSDPVTHANNGSIRALRCSQWVSGDLDTAGDSKGIDELVGLNYGKGCINVAVDEPSAYVAEVVAGNVDLGDPLDTKDDLLAPDRLILTPLDNDGANDLMVFYSGDPEVSGSAGFTVYWGDGGGTLAFNSQTVSDFGLGSLEDAGPGIQMRDIAPIDLDGDGFPEVAILTNQGVFVVTFADDGDHKIYNDPKLLIPAAAPDAGRIKAADLNGDGVEDLAVSDGQSIRIFLQKPAPALGDGSGDDAAQGAP